jgi:hypothetical protein
MRVPTLEPRRRFRFRGWIIGAVIVLIVLLFSLRGLAGFYTDYCGSTRWGGAAPERPFAARVAPALVFTIVFFVIMFVNLVIADRLAPKAPVDGPEDGLIALPAGRRSVRHAHPHRRVAVLRVDRGHRRVVAMEAVGALRTTRASTRSTRSSTGHFYVFQLPFLKFISGGSSPGS